MFFIPDYMKKLNEVDVNGENIDNDNQDTGSDYTMPEPVNAAGNDNTQQEPPEEEPADNNPPAEDDSTDYTDNDDAPPADEGGDTDYTDEGGEGGDTDYTDEGDPEGGEDAPPDDNAGGGDNQVTADDARGLENEIFSDLTSDQIDLKHKELKTNFTELYDSTSSIIERVNQIPNNDDYIATISFVSDQLANLRKMVADYMNNVYSTKSYMENAMNYNRFLAILKGINDILEEISKDIQ